jgi:hypothetical protein
MEPKNSLAWSNEDARTVRSGRSGRAVEKRLHGAVEEGAIQPDQMTDIVHVELLYSVTNDNSDIIGKTLFYRKLRKQKETRRDTAQKSHL